MALPTGRADVSARRGPRVVLCECKDAGASEVNQLNRLKLMLSVAKEKCPEGMHMAEAAETAENSLA